MEIRAGPIKTPTFSGTQVVRNFRSLFGQPANENRTNLIWSRALSWSASKAHKYVGASKFRLFLELDDSARMENFFGVRHVPVELLLEALDLMVWLSAMR